MIGFASGPVKNQSNKQGTKPVLRGSDFVDLKGIRNKLLGMKYSLPPPVKTENRCNNKDYIRVIFFFQLSKLKLSFTTERTEPVLLGTR